MANQIVCVLAKTYGCEWAEDMQLCWLLVTPRSLIACR